MFAEKKHITLKTKKNKQNNVSRNIKHVLVPCANYDEVMPF